MTSCCFSLPNALATFYTCSVSVSHFLSNPPTVTVPSLDLTRAIILLCECAPFVAFGRVIFPSPKFYFPDLLSTRSSAQSFDICCDKQPLSTLSPLLSSTR